MTKCQNGCTPPTSGDCMSADVGVYECFDKNELGNCPSCTIDCSNVNNALQLQNKNKNNINKEKQFETSISNDYKLMISIIIIAFVAFACCITAILVYQRISNKKKYAGFNTINSTDFDTEATTSAPN